MRRSVLKTSALAALAVVACTVELSDVKLAVVLPGGVTISSVTYTVLSSSNATIAGPGTFSVTDPNATIP